MAKPTAALVSLDRLALTLITRVPVAATALAVALAGCGERRENTDAPAPAPAKAAAAGVSANSVLACLKGKNLKASRRQAGGDRLRVEYSGGSVFVYVFPSRSVATRKRETLAVASKTSGGGVRQHGNVVTVADQGTPPAITATVRACLPR